MLFRCFLYFLILVSFSGCRTRQKAAAVERYHGKYFHGYLITTTGDTLKGRIKAQDEYDTKISFIHENTDKKVILKSEGIKSMKINIMLFEKLTINGKHRMYEKVANGSLDLFAYHYLKGDFSENVYYLNTADGPLRIEADSFNEIAAKYLFDCPRVREKILSKELGYDNMIEIFRIYNNCKRQKDS